MTERYESVFEKKATTGTGHTYDFVKRLCKKVRDLEFKTCKQSTEEVMRLVEIRNMLQDET